MFPAPPPSIAPADYDAIEQAVMETARGRWFLMEFARRQRAAETHRLAEIADQLQAMLALRPPALPAPAPQAVEIAERLSDIAWSMRERGFDGALCAEIDRQAGLVRALRLQLREQRRDLLERRAQNRFQDRAQDRTQDRAQNRAQDRAQEGWPQNAWAQNGWAQNAWRQGGWAKDGWRQDGWAPNDWADDGTPSRQDKASPSHQDKASPSRQDHARRMRQELVDDRPTDDDGDGGDVSDNDPGESAGDPDGLTDDGRPALREATPAPGARVRQNAPATGGSSSPLDRAAPTTPLRAVPPEQELRTKPRIGRAPSDNTAQDNAPANNTAQDNTAQDKAPSDNAPLNNAPANSAPLASAPRSGETHGGKPFARIDALTFHRKLALFC